MGNCEVLFFHNAFVLIVFLDGSFDEFIFDQSPANGSPQYTVYGRRVLRDARVASEWVAEFLWWRPRGMQRSGYCLIPVVVP